MKKVNICAIVWFYALYCRNAMDRTSKVQQFMCYTRVLLLNADLLQGIFVNNETEVMEFIALFVRQTDLFSSARVVCHSVSHVSQTTAQKSCCDVTRLTQAHVAIALFSQARDWLLDK